MRDADGQFVGAALAYKDVTDYVRALALKDDFVALLSHELRTPLSSVLGHLEIGRGERRPAPRTSRTGSASSSATPLRMRRLVGDLLHVVQGAGGLALETGVCDLTEVVGAALEAAQPDADVADVSVETDLPETLPAVVDAGRIRQVLDTLVSLGISAAGRTATLRVTLALTGDQVELGVTEHQSTGITPTDLDRRFTDTPGQELHGPEHRPRPARLVRAIVEAHGPGTRPRADQLRSAGHVTRARRRLPGSWPESSTPYNNGPTGPGHCRSDERRTAAAPGGCGRSAVRVTEVSRRS